ncbi:MAG: putative signal transducing protein, partial [Gammaproteobacteria bacterium]
MADAFVRIYRAANGLEAHMIKGMLEQHGMQVRVFGIGLSSDVGELPADV